MRKKNFTSSNSVLKYEDIDEDFTNIPWIDDTLARVFQRSSYKMALQYFFKFYEKDPQHNSRNALDRASKVLGLEPKPLQKYVTSLIKKGKIPKKYSF